MQTCRPHHVQLSFHQAEYNDFACSPYDTMHTATAAYMCTSASSPHCEQLLLACRLQACVLCHATHALFAACLMATHLAWMAASASGVMGMSWLVPWGVPHSSRHAR